MKAKSIIPCLSYRDTNAAIEWLGKAFGFEKHLVVPDEDGKIVHAELILDDVMIMIGPADSGSPYSKFIKQPDELGNKETQTPYIVLGYPDAIYQRAKENGATILIDIKTEDYGGRGFTCSDPEGHIWNFGSYDPLAS